MESLKMLESEEGQLNAVFACYGSAMQHGQFFEQALDEFLEKYKEWTKAEFPLQEFLSKKTPSKKTMGQLLRIFLEKVEINDLDVQNCLRDAREQRNMLAHEYFLTRDTLFKTIEGRMNLLHELVAIEESLRMATDLVNGMRVAVEETLKGGTRDTEASETLFSIKVDLNARKN